MSLDRPLFLRAILSYLLQFFGLVFGEYYSLLKLLYVGMLNSSEKWTMTINNCGQTMMQLSIHFPGRLDAVMSL
ncbi:hypothetical protein ENHY17A_340014 [Moraxellaceae bacterium 17A]|nr:hypothetical protein ENHY17A_340014 [Moraxellaceae bacterium 17A]